MTDHHLELGVFARLSGYAITELLGKPHNIVRHPETPRAVFKLREYILIRKLYQMREERGDENPYTPFLLFAASLRRVSCPNVSVRAENNDNAL